MDVYANPGVHFLSADLQGLITRSRDAQENINHNICQGIMGELKCCWCLTLTHRTREPGNSLDVPLTSLEIPQSF